MTNLFTCPVENTFTNTDYGFTFPESDKNTDNTMYTSDLFETKNIFSFPLSGYNPGDKIDFIPDDSDEMLTDSSYRLAMSSLAEDWNSPEDDIWDTF